MPDSASVLTRQLLAQAVSRWSAGMAVCSQSLDRARASLGHLPRDWRESIMAASACRWLAAGPARGAVLPDVAECPADAAKGPLPRHPGWTRRDWTPDAAGPIRALSLHCQTEPDSFNPRANPGVDPHASRDGGSPGSSSPWRFEITVTPARGQPATILGRLDPAGLKLLVKGKRVRSAFVKSRLVEQAAMMRLEDQRPVSLRIDMPRGSPAPAQKSVDHRA